MTAWRANRFDKASQPCGLRAVESLAAKLGDLANNLDVKPLSSLERDDAVFENGELRSKKDPSVQIAIGELLNRAGLDEIKNEETAKPGWRDLWSQLRKSWNTHSAIFAEVKVNEELSVVRVTRIVIAVAAGRIINPKTARSQILGGVVMGIGMALHEERLINPRLGTFHEP